MCCLPNISKVLSLRPASCRLLKKGEEHDVDGAKDQQDYYVPSLRLKAKGKRRKKEYKWKRCVYNHVLAHFSPLRLANNCKVYLMWFSSG